MSEVRGHDPWLGGEGHWNFKEGWEAVPELEEKVHKPSKRSAISRKHPAAIKALFQPNSLINFPPAPTQTGVTGVGGAYRQVLEQPGSQGVGGHFGENSSFFAVQFFLFGVVVFSGAGRRHAMIQTVTCKQKVNISFSLPSA